MKNNRAIYFDHQATTPVDSSVLRRMVPYFSEQFGNPHSVDHAVGWRSSRAVAGASAQIAALIGAEADEIIFTSGATEANNLALLGLAGHCLGKRRRILMSAIEHKSVLATTSVLTNRYDCQVETLPVDSEGRMSVEVLEAALDETVLAVSIMAVNNEIGTIQDIHGLSMAARKAGAVFHCDAAQMPLARSSDRLARDVDLASLSAHKMYGPTGIGVLYVRRDLQQEIEPLMHGGGQQNGLRSGTVPVPLCVGMGAAAEMLLSDQMVAARSALRGLRDRFVEKLRRLPWRITLNGPSDDNRHPGNANVCFHGFSAHDILTVLQPNVAASTGSACSSGIPGPSHVLRAIGLSGDDADASVRFSFGFHTNDAEIEEAIALIAAALERLSEITTTCSVGQR
jgi:cysteine desulfurase